MQALVALAFDGISTEDRTAEIGARERRYSTDLAAAPIIS
jgi:hypothetical protein